MATKIKTGDTVSVLLGKDRGKTGKVIQVLRNDLRVAVEGINQMTKNVKARGTKGAEKGQKITFWGPIHLSNVALVCPKCSKKTRVGMKRLEDGKGVRVCKQCNEVL